MAKVFTSTKLYADLYDHRCSVFLAGGLSSMEELMAVPVRSNSGSLSTNAAAMSLFPFVPLNSQSVQVDEVALADDGHKVRKAIDFS